jgi:hypothetical protein
LSDDAIENTVVASFEASIRQQKGTQAAGLSNRSQLFIQLLVYERILIANGAPFMSSSGAKNEDVLLVALAVASQLLQFTS